MNAQLEKEEYFPLLLIFPLNEVIRPRCELLMRNKIKELDF